MGLGISIRLPPHISFKQGQIGASFNLEPQQALEFFLAKGLKETFSWVDMFGEEHVKAFTVAKMLDIDLLADTKALLDEAMAEGKTLQWLRDNLTPHLEKKGWWGKQEMIDPLTGQVHPVQLGSAARLETIFRTNMQSSYSVGHWQQIQENADTAPWLMYDAVDDHRTRESHAALDNTILKVTDSFWDEFMPPNGYNCRCSVIQLSDDELEEFGYKPSKRPKIKNREWTNPRTGKTRKVPEVVTPGFDVNMGQEQLKVLSKALGDKIAALDKGPRKQILKFLAGSTAGYLVENIISSIRESVDERIKNNEKLKALYEKIKDTINKSLR